MAYKTMIDLNPETVVTLGGKNKKTGKANPTSVEGFYLGKRSVVDKKKKSGVSYIYVFETPKGIVGVWGKTDLDNKMLTAVRGQMHCITFDRMVNTPNGEMYKFTVQFDPDQTIEVAELVTSHSLDYTSPESSDEEYLDNSNKEEEYPGYDEENVATRNASIERKNKFEEMIRKTKS